jgi:hypothetical protein
VSLTGIPSRFISRFEGRPPALWPSSRTIPASRVVRRAKGAARPGTCSVKMRVLAEHGAQGRLGQHVRGRQIVLDLDNCALRIDDVEVEHRVDLHRDIVVGDHVLAGDFNDLSAGPREPSPG